MAANILQSRFETAVVEQDRLHELGCKGLFLIIVMIVIKFVQYLCKKLFNLLILK